MYEKNDEETKKESFMKALIVSKNNILNTKTNTYETRVHQPSHPDQHTQPQETHATTNETYLPEYEIHTNHMKITQEIISIIHLKE